MRVIIANCSAVYAGRGNTTLSARTRAIIIKKDGCVSIHNETSNKPLNYMGKDSVLTESTDDNDNNVLRFETRKENLTITIYQTLSDIDLPMDEEDEGLVRDGTEDHLQAWIAKNPECLGKGWTLIQREFPTGSGPVDLLVRDEDGKEVAVEVKRVAMLNTVYQILRYVDALNQTDEYDNVQGVIAALDIRPKTAELAAKRGIKCITLPADWNTTLGA